MEKLKILDRIITGFTPVFFFDRTFRVYDPSYLIKYEANCYYQEVYDNLILEGVLTRDESLDLLINKGRWSKSLEDEIVKNQEDYIKLQRALADCEYRSLEKNRLKEAIRQIDERNTKLSVQKNGLLNHTAEYLARIEKYKKIIFLSTYEGDKRVWSDWSSFYNEENNKAIYKIVQEVFFKENISESDIRFLARTDPWRTMWRVGLKTGRLLDKAVIDYSDYQKTLCMWSMIYDSAYEAYEPPDQETIEDDAKFDVWLTFRKASSKSDPVFNNPKLNNANEVGIVVETAEDAQKVYNLNSQASLGVIRGREKALQKKGVLKECELPDAKQRIAMEKAQAFKNMPR